MDESPSPPTDGPDVLIWRMASDSLDLALMTAVNLVRASLVHPDARTTAQQRVHALSAMATKLIRAASEMQDRVDGTGQIGEFDRIVEGFWSDPDQFDEAA